MNRRTFHATGAVIVVVSLLASMGCSTTSGQSADPAARRQTIDAGVDQALSQLQREIPTSQGLISSAKGVLVFPSVLTGGFIVGASHGQGALRKGGTTAGYFSTTALSVGLLAGAQSKAVFILFMTEDALARFEASQGWTAGVDGSVALITVGAAAQVTTQTGQQPIVGFILTNAGLMANLSLDGTRIARLNL
jgi:lipid-binding SYLF domain-containing protein